MCIYVFIIILEVLRINLNEHVDCNKWLDGTSCFHATRSQVQINKLVV